MIKGKTESGFEFEIDEGIKDDYEFFETLVQVDDGKITKFPEMIRRLLGEKQTEKLKEHLREKEGRISTTKMMDEVKQILQAEKELKN